MEIPGLNRRLLLPAVLVKAGKMRKLVSIKFGFGFINMFG
jgi:hypothetical protein